MHGFPASLLAELAEVFPKIRLVRGLEEIFVTLRVDPFLRQLPGDGTTLRCSHSGSLHGRGTDPDPYGAETRSTANAFLRCCTPPNVHEDIVQVGVIQEPRPTVIKGHGVHLDAHTLVVTDEESPGHRVTFEADVEAPHVGTAYLELIPDPFDDVLVATVDGDRVCNGTA